MVSLALRVLAFGSITLPVLAQGDEQSAAEAFAKAEALASRGSYSAAHAAYRKIAQRWPSTAAGELALTRSGPTAFIGWSYLVESGPGENRVDVAILGEGFTLSEQNRFDDMAKRVPTDFESREVFEEYIDHHNFIRVNLASKDGDVDSHGREYDTALDGRMMGRNAPYLVVSRQRVHEMLAGLPSHDGLAIVFTKAKGLSGTGGAGVAAVSAGGDRLVNHEWGHAFGGLADEYTTFTHERGNLGSAPNIASTDDPKRVPWAHWIEADAPGIGVYRGGAGRLKGAWRPCTTTCVMHKGREFCTVCREALVLRIYEHVDPIDTERPGLARDGREAEQIGPERDGRYRFEVDLVQPKSHGLDVEWFVFEQGQEPPAAAATADRRQRGPLPEISARPADRARGWRKRTHRFLWRPPVDASGRYRIVCRVRDRTEVGSGLPWVLKDERGLLESERGWWVDL